MKYGADLLGMPFFNRRDENSRLSDFEANQYRAAYIRPLASMRLAVSVSMCFH